MIDINEVMRELGEFVQSVASPALSELKERGTETGLSVIAATVFELRVPHGDGKEGIIRMLIGDHTPDEILRVVSDIVSSQKNGVDTDGKTAGTITLDT